MSGLRQAIGQIPSKPGLVLAALVAIGIGTWHYGRSWIKCSELHTAREQLKSAIDQAASASAPLDLAAVFPGNWDEARIVQSHKPGEKRPLDCPFGWDLSAQQRSELIEAGKLTLIGLFKDGTFQRYVEFRSDWAVFEGLEQSTPKRNAVFEVEKSSAIGNPVTLRLKAVR